MLKLTSKSGAQGADIIMGKDNFKYAVQVKFYFGNNLINNC